MQAAPVPEARRLEIDILPERDIEPIVKVCEPDTNKAMPKKHRINLFGRSLPLPQSVWWRRILGGGLIVGGVFSFLPLLGVWMLPLGLIVLSRDSKRIRRIRRKSEVGLTRRWRAFRSGKKAKQTAQPD